MMRLLRSLACDVTGSMAVETALVVPVLALMSVGTFEVSAMVSRQSELQSAAAEASAIALAAMPNNQAERDTVEEVIEASSGLPDAKVTVEEAFRCGTNAAYVTTTAACAAGDVQTTYLKIFLTDTYEPMWTEFGLGGDLTYNVTRYVMLEQEA
jgi:Flp pilus assembly protein TadG